MNNPLPDRHRARPRTAVVPAPGPGYRPSKAEEQASEDAVAASLRAKEEIARRHSRGS